MPELIKMSMNFNQQANQQSQQVQPKINMMSNTKKLYAIKISR